MKPRGVSTAPRGFWSRKTPSHLLDRVPVQRLTNTASLPEHMVVSNLRVSTQAVNSNPHVGHGLRCRLDGKPPRRLRPVARHARPADKRREHLAATDQLHSRQSRGAERPADHARAPSHSGEAVSYTH